MLSNRYFCLYNKIAGIVTGNSHAKLIPSICNHSYFYKSTKLCSEKVYSTFSTCYFFCLKPHTVLKTTSQSIRCCSNICNYNNSNNNKLQHRMTAKDTNLTIRSYSNKCSHNNSNNNKLRHGMTIKDIIQSCIQTLNDAHVPEPENSAEYIVNHVLHIERNNLRHSQDRILDEAQLADVERLMICRLERMPVQYIIGSWDFHSITLKMRPPVFIPRQETEELVCLALDRISHIKDPKVLEIGCGSGAISLSMLHSNKSLECTAIDQSQHAINLTHDNASELGLSTRLKLINAKVTTEEMPKLPHKNYDLIISNPPYVLRKDLAKLASEIMLYEDLRALDGGKDGLDVIKGILQHCKHLLNSEGLILLEVDPCHQFLLPKLLETNKDAFSLTIEEIHEDYCGRKRFIELKKL